MRMLLGGRILGLGLGGVVFALGGGSFAAECEVSSPTVRVMLHEPAVLSARLALLGNTPEKPADRVAAFRKLFEAAGCPQISEQGEGERRNVECTVPGTGDGAIVVGVSQEFDSLGSAALLSSLAEAIAAAPRRHTFRWVAFSGHQHVDRREGELRTQKPKGAMRFVSALSEAERGRAHAMVHIGPIGFGAPMSHPDGADERLGCVLAAAALALRIELIAPDRDALLRRMRCGELDEAIVRCPDERVGDWSGSLDWLPFRRAGISVFGVHSADPTKFVGNLDGKSYYATYRLLAVFLALADDALAAAGPAGAISPR